MKSGFENIDTKIYKQFRHKYLPSKIKVLFIAEAPPAFRGSEPMAYFYFDQVPKADSLFYTLVKSIYNIDFDKHQHNRIEILNQLKRDGYFLIDTVEFPINKSREWLDIPNHTREQIISANREYFENYLKSLWEEEKLDDNTKTILIKETVYNNYCDNKLLNVLNKNSIGFPQYIKDRKVIESIRALLKNST